MKITHQPNIRKLTVPFFFNKDYWSELDKKLINIIESSRNLRLYKNSTFIDFVDGNFFVSKMVIGHESLFDQFSLKDEVAKKILSFELVKIPETQLEWENELENCLKIANASGYAATQNSSLELEYHVDQFSEFSLKYKLHISL